MKDKRLYYYFLCRRKRTSKRLVSAHRGERSYFFTFMYIKTLVEHSTTTYLLVGGKELQGASSAPTAHCGERWSYFLLFYFFTFFYV